jgi:hypothetical protein
VTRTVCLLHCRLIHRLIHRHRCAIAGIVVVVRCGSWAVRWFNLIFFDYLYCCTLLLLLLLL